MAITSCIPNAGKLAILKGEVLPGHTFKIALYTNAASLDKATAAYTATNEVANGNGYATAGATLSGYAAAQYGDAATIDFTSDPSWAAASFTARGCMIYDDTHASKVPIAIIDFGADYTCTNGTFTVTLPAAAEATALIRIS